LSLIRSNLVVKQLLSHNDFSKHTQGTQLDKFAILLLANCYLTGVRLEAANMTIGEALLGFLKHQCTVDHECVVFGLNGILTPRSGNFFLEDELYIPMPGPCVTNCAAGFRGLYLLKKVFRHAYDLLTTGKPLRQVLSSHKHKLIKVDGPLDRFAPSDSVYIGGLPSTASEADVSRLIESVLHRPPHRVVVRQKSPQSPKHSFIWVGDMKSAKCCVYALNGKPLYGRRICVNFATPSKMQTDQQSLAPIPLSKNECYMQGCCVEENRWFPPRLAPFPMVMVPLRCAYPEQGFPLSMPFCMPPPEYNHSIANQVKPRPADLPATAARCHTELLIAACFDDNDPDDDQCASANPRDFNDRDALAHFGLSLPANFNHGSGGGGSNDVCHAINFVSSSSSFESFKSNCSRGSCTSGNASEDMSSGASSEDDEEREAETARDYFAFTNYKGAQKHKSTAAVDEEGTAVLKMLMNL
jgi:hypothetical protein